MRLGNEGCCAEKVREPCAGLLRERERKSKSGECARREFVVRHLLFFFVSFCFPKAAPPIDRAGEAMPRRRRAVPRLLPALSLIIALFLSYSCAHGYAEQSPAKPAAAAAAARAAMFSPSPASSSTSLADNPDLPTVSSSGYVPNGGPDRGGGQLFYAYYEKRNGSSSNPDDPIFLWLEGGPGCASTFGALYINGPDRVLVSRGAEGGGPRRRRAMGKLRNNAHAWNALGGVLYVDQPVGTGLSVPGREGEGGGPIPQTEVEVAADLYFGLCELFGAGGPLEALASRPLFVTGESYAGKFVPSIAHYILQVEAETRTERRRATAAAAATAGVVTSSMRVRRELRRDGGLPPRPPPFHLAGIAVVSGILVFLGVFFFQRERITIPRETDKKTHVSFLKTRKS